MPAVTLDFTGDKELLGALDKLTSDARREVVDRALMEAGDYVLGNIHKHHRSKRLRQHMRPMIWHGDRGRTSVNIATPRRTTLGITPDDPHYWPSAYNYGYTAKNGTVVPGAHYMEKGYDESEAVVADQIDELIWEGIEEVWERG